MRLPNGYGSITKLSGKRRRPYMVRITTGWTDDGKQILKVLGYYSSKSAALASLTEFNAAPVDLDAKRMTFNDIWRAWTRQEFGRGEIPKQYNVAYGWCKPLWDKLFIELKTNDFQKVIDCCDRSYSSKCNIKTLCNKLTRYAMVNDIVSKPYAHYAKVPTTEQSSVHQPFTTQEIEKLWENSSDIGCQIALILIYTGMRPTELLKIERSNINLDEQFMIGGIKTKSSKNRFIPIADKILPFIKGMLAHHTDSSFLLPNPHTNGELSYSTFRSHFWLPTMKKLSMEHLAHDGRHTCASLLNNADINSVIIKKILGHAGDGVTEKVYTHKTARQLVEAVNKI